MRFGATISAVFHLTVILVAWIGLPHLFDSTDEYEQSIPVEVVTVEKRESPPPKAKPEPPKPKPQAAPPPPPQQVARIEAPPLAQPVAEPPPPESVTPLPAPVVVTPPPEPAQPAKKAEPRVKPKPKTKRKPPPPNPMSSVLKTVEKLKAESEPVEQAMKLEIPETPRRSSVDVARLRLTLADEVRRQIEPCWNLPAGAKDAGEHIVEIRVAVNPNGQVRSAQIVDNVRMSRDPFYRAAAESAMRAVLNPRCNPLKNLPIDDYDEWRTMTLRFDPKEMIGS